MNRALSVVSLPDERVQIFTATRSGEVTIYHRDAESPSVRRANAIAWHLAPQAGWTLSPWLGAAIGWHLDERPQIG